MIKRLFLFVLIVLIALLSSSPAKAVKLPARLYVNESLTTNGNGTSASPYNNFQDAINLARSLPGGANIYEWRGNTWAWWGYISPAISGGTGLPLPTVSLYILLAVVALVMALAGLQLRRRARQLQH